MSQWSHAVVARFDEATDQKLIALKAAFRAEGLSGIAGDWPPHITLATYETAPVDALLAWTAEYAAGQAPFPVALGACGVFPPGGDTPDTAVLYAAPASSQRLVDFYFGFHRKFDEHAGASGFFYSAAFGHPAIHATLGILPTHRMQRAFDLVFASGIFGKAEITALEVYAHPLERLARYPLGVRTIVVIPWQSTWPEAFLQIKGELETALAGAALAIEHVGSTAVPGLAAKPIIDIDIVIEADAFETVKQRLAAIGYAHTGDQGIPGREAFHYTGKEHLMPHHLYACPKDSPELRRHLALRDCLRANPALRDQYSQVKIALAEQHPHDINAYIDGKSSLVQEIYKAWGI
ncbi:MAG: GrpB family protein [Oscillospiraceae bacterium]|jgi:GrpB-like predicted nucleotidyltransferase (UPF0157 family)|nr:GrpB family protein [Oscillospiraceae bacterium]